MWEGFGELVWVLISGLGLFVNEGVLDTNNILKVTDDEKLKDTGKEV